MLGSIQEVDEGEPDGTIRVLKIKKGQNGSMMNKYKQAKQANHRSLPVLQPIQESQLEAFEGGLQNEADEAGDRQSQQSQETEMAKDSDEEDQWLRTDLNYREQEDRKRAKMLEEKNEIVKKINESNQRMIRHGFAINDAFRNPEQRKKDHEKLTKSLLEHEDYNLVYRNELMMQKRLDRQLEVQQN